MATESKNKPQAKRKKIQKKLTSFFSINTLIQEKNEQSIHLCESTCCRRSQPEFGHVEISQKNLKG